MMDSKKKGRTIGEDTKKREKQEDRINKKYREVKMETLY